jgi:hypothetical protein
MVEEVGHRAVDLEVGEYIRQYSKNRDDPCLGE